MTQHDYAKLGLKCGLEIHQQLEGRKLFSHCATTIRDDEPEGTIVRRLRAVAGEEGHVDVAAIGEMRKERSFVYEYYNNGTSLVELDEAPPVPLNHDALMATLQLSKLVQATPVDQAHVMRKTVIDGSNTSGFQRTALIARNGMLRSSSGDITIPTICLEEDAARIIGQTADVVTYRLDRLGIPLIEIATGPEIKHPDQALDVAQRLGMLLRSTGKVKRGLGTIRQDLNVSIAGGQRVEIKGAQELKMLPTLVQFEVDRQLALLQIAKDLKERKSATHGFKDVTSAFQNASGIIGTVIKQGGVVRGLRLCDATGLLGREVQQGRRFGTELSDAAKIASGVKGIIHSDEQLSKYNIGDGENNAIRSTLGCGQGDAFVLVAAPLAQAEKALTAVAERYNMAFKGVPKEVRKANIDGTTSFLRPMPGAARMYPETDIPTLTITKEILERIVLPERIDERSARYVKLGLAKDLADLAAGAEEHPEFEDFLRKFTALKPAYLAEVFFTSGRTINRQFNIDITPTTEDFEVLFSSLQANLVPKEAVLDILKERKPVMELIAKYKSLSDDDLDKALDEIITKNPGKPYNALIGIAMGTLRGKAPGQKVNERLKKKLGQ